MSNLRFVLCAIGCFASCAPAFNDNSVIDDGIFDQVYLFITSPDYTGNLGGRTGADTKCATQKAALYPSLACTNVRAMISVDGADEVRDMPANFGVPTSAPVQRPSGLQIAPNFTTFLTGSNNFTNPVTASQVSFWSATGFNGQIGTYECVGWTEGTGFDGVPGDSDELNVSNFFYAGGEVDCGSSFALACLCW